MVHKAIRAVILVACSTTTAAVRPAADEMVKWPADGKSLVMVPGETVGPMGELSSEGEQQVETRIRSVGRYEEFNVWGTLAETDHIWAAPTRAAMATAMLAMMAAIGHGRTMDMQTFAWANPRLEFHVHYGLRGLDPIEPEDCGENSDLLRYLTDVGMRAKERWNAEQGVGSLDPVPIARQLVESYKKWAERTDGWATNLPNSSTDVYGNIHEVKYTISDTHAKVLMVTDPQVTAYMLMGLLGSEDKAQSLKSGRIEKVPLLAPAGLLEVRWQESLAVGARKVVKPWEQSETVAMFTKVEAATEYTLVDGVTLPIFSSRSMPVPFDAQAWVMDEVRGKLPLLSTWYSFDIMKQKRKFVFWSPKKTRRVTVAWTTFSRSVSGGRVGYIAWSTLFGETWKGFTLLSEVDVLEQSESTLVEVKNRRTRERWRFDTGDSDSAKLFAARLREGQEILKPPP